MALQGSALFIGSWEVNALKSRQGAWAIPVLQKPHKLGQDSSGAARDPRGYEISVRGPWICLHARFHTPAERDSILLCVLFSQDIRQNDGKERRYQSGSPALPQTSWETDHKQVMEGLNFLICECPIGLDGPEVPFRA